MVEALDGIIRAGMSDGTIRSGMGAETVFAAMSGACASRGLAGWDTVSQEIVPLLMRALRS
ncbi:hypothetical protein ABIB56_003750 [Glaciihabitans sp. UYNi722]